MKIKLPPKEKYQDAALTLHGGYWEELNKVDLQFEHIADEEADAEISSNDLMYEWKYERVKLSGIYELCPDGRIRPKFKVQDTGLSLLKAIAIPSHGPFRLPVPDQRVFIHVQTKNKHPHSTKKHK